MTWPYHGAIGFVSSVAHPTPDAGRTPSMSGRLLNATLLLTLATFPAAGMLLLLLIGPFGGGGWARLLVASLLLSLAVAWGAHRRRWSALLSDAAPTGSPVSPRGIAWALVVLLALLPTVIAVIASPRVQISHHGYFHSAYVHQVIAGMVPPENVTLPGHPSNTYWPYHALLAAMVTLLGVPAPLASALLNLILLAGSLGWSAAIACELYGPLRRGLGGVVAVFGLFGANLLGGLYWLMYVAAGTPAEPRVLVLLGDTRLATLLAKFANYTGAALGVYFYVFVLLVTVRLLRGRARPFDLLLAAAALLGAFALHAITGAFIAAGFPLAAAAGALLAAALDGRLPAALAPARVSATLRGWLGPHAVPTLVGVIALLVLAAPVLHFVASASSEFPEPPRIGLPDAYALSIVATSYPLLPFFVLGIVHGWRRRDASVLFLALVCLGGYALASVVSISGRNEYKFIYLGSIGLCLVALEPIVRVLRDAAGARRPVLRALAWTALLLPCLNVATFGIGQIRGPLWADPTFAYDGSHVVAAPGAPPSPGTGLELADLFAWVRDNTPADTVVVVPLLFRDRSVLYVLAERVPYVVDGMHYNRGLPDFQLRAAQVAALYGPTSSIDERAAALHDIAATLPERSKVLVYPQRLRSAFDPASVGFAPLYQGAVADLYAFPGPAGAAS